MAEVEAPTKTPAIDKSGPVRKFSDAAIQSSIDKALAVLPADEIPNGTMAAVVFEGNVVNGKPEMGIAFVGAKRLGDGKLRWEVGGTAQWNEKLDWGAKAKVSYVWTLMLAILPALN